MVKSPPCLAYIDHNSQMVIFKWFLNRVVGTLTIESSQVQITCTMTASNQSDTHFGGVPAMHEHRPLVLQKLKSLCETLPDSYSLGIL